MTLPLSSRFQFTADLGICRILNGMWQVSGAHGSIDPVRAVDEMFAYHVAGFSTWDLADHDGPAEDLSEISGAGSPPVTAESGFRKSTRSPNGFRIPAA